MGLNIKDIIPRKEIAIPDLKDKLVFVDAYNMLYQFLSTIRQPDGTPLMDNKRRVTSHLSGIFYRNVNLIAEGIKLVYVFDGQPPELKGKIHELRSEARNLAKSKYEEAKRGDDEEGMKRYSSQIIRLDSEMIAESKELLEAMGIGVVQAPGEGEAEAAYLSKVKPSYGVVSQDYDSLLFGATRLIRNLGLARKRKTVSGWREIRPELIELDKVLNALEIDLDQLICIGILVGTDYNPRGIPGIGQKRALEIVKKFKQPVLIFESVAEQLKALPEKEKFNWQEIFELFHRPRVANADLILTKVDESKIKDILVRRHDFSEERVENQFQKLREVKEQKKQKSLGKWF